MTLTLVVRRSENAKIDGITPSFRRVVCPVMSKSSDLK